MKLPLAIPRLKRDTVSRYLGDFYLQGKDAPESSHTVRESVQLFLKFGFFIHAEKSVLTPKNEITFLGFILNSVLMMVRLSGKKK